MKRFFLLTLIMLLIAIVVACGKDKSSDDQAVASTKIEVAEKSEKESVEVDKGILNVEIKLPASMFKGKDIEAVISELKKDGVKEVIQNEDGSLTYKMSKAKHKEMMKEMKDGVLEGIEKTKSNENITSIKDISYSEDFSEFTLIVDQEKYENSLEGFAALSLGVSGMYYQLYNGGNSEDSKVTILLKNESSGEVFKTIVYPDALKKTE